MSSVELEIWLSKVKEFSVSELLAMQETITQELKQKTANVPAPKPEPISAPGRFGQPQRKIIIPGAYETTPAEVEAELAAIFTPEERAEMAKVDLINLPPLPAGAKTSTQIISEDREDRF